MSDKKPKVLVAMSGGVDSSVSAALLLENGYEVIGGFMKNWSDCAWREDRRDAIRVAANLGIPLHTFDFEKEYRNAVVENLFSEYAALRTPNPDVLCNKHIKFDLFMREADRLGCDFIATGHYARVQNGILKKAVDENKDQTYFLWAVPKTALKRVIFPVGELTKLQVRKKAKEVGLSVAQKKDSQGICFIGEVSIFDFLKERIAENPGAVVTTSGEKVGTHRGVAFYTIGQRQFTGAACGEPRYVVEKRKETNELVVAGNYHPSLYKKSLQANQCNFFVNVREIIGAKIQARIRYRQSLVPCMISKYEVGDTVFVEFNSAQRAVTSGQSIVFYRGEECVGGGVIA